jgi:hypothetical protein
MTAPGSNDNDEDDEPHAGGGRGNLAALIAVVVLIGLGYLAFNFIDQQRKLQNCLDSGRHDCQDLMNSGK